MSKYLYFHGGSYNHGCEAIVRSTTKILNGEITLASSECISDKQYGVDEIANLFEDKECHLSTTESLLAALYFKAKHSDYYFTCFRHKNLLEKVQKNDICFSIGGDNYCYKGQDILAHYNKALRKKGAKTVLWGCSVEPDVIKDDIAKDLASYDAIIARESISYNALKQVNSNTYLCCDPAFLLETEDVSLPDEFLENNTVGINVSPLILQYEKNEGATLKNYISLVNHIIYSTDMNIALIPHVVQDGNDDREALKILYDSIEEKNRVCIIPDGTAPQLKGYISKCRFFIGARTHATIAAYSTTVPTLVVGYSVKSKGIAKDIFGTYDNYVLPVQDLEDANVLSKSFDWMMQNEQRIRTHLTEFIPEYKKTIEIAKKAVSELI